MKNLSTYFFIISVGFLTFIGGCKKDKTEPSEFIIQVDSIQVADTLNSGDTLAIVFFGTIGPNGCYSFDRFDAEFSGDTIRVTAMGMFSGGEVCPEYLPMLDGATLKVSNLIPGNYVVAVKEPDNTLLTEDVQVISP